jgi:hypothetical protein
MRQVIFILLVVNIAYFSWNMLRTLPHEEGGNHVRRMPDNVRRLETIQERGAKGAGATKGESATQRAPDPGGDASVTGGPQENARALKNSGPQGGTAAQQSVVQPEAAELRRVEALTASQPPGAGARESTCHVLGPFHDEKTMKAVEGRLNQFGYKAKERTGEARVEAGYRVYLPAMERDEAVRIAHMLDEKNDGDFLIVKGNAVSLGVYDSRARADRRMEMLSKYGLEPVVQPRYATRTEHWLDLDLPDDGNTVLETIRGEYQNVEIQDPPACELQQTARFTKILR